MGQPKMKYWILHELQVKNVHPISAYAPKIWKSSILSSSRNTFFQTWGGGGGGGSKFNSLGLDHSGSQPFNYVSVPTVSCALASFPVSTSNVRRGNGDWERG